MTRAVPGRVKFTAGDICGWNSRTAKSGPRGLRGKQLWNESPMVSKDVERKRATSHAGLVQARLRAETAGHQGKELVNGKDRY